MSIVKTIRTVLVIDNTTYLSYWGKGMMSIKKPVILVFRHKYA